MDFEKYRREVVSELMSQSGMSKCDAEIMSYCFEDGYKGSVGRGDVPAPADDVSEEIGCWSE